VRRRIDGHRDRRVRADRSGTPRGDRRDRPVLGFGRGRPHHRPGDPGGRRLGGGRVERALLPAARHASLANWGGPPLSRECGKPDWPVGPSAETATLDDRRAPARWRGACTGRRLPPTTSRIRQRQLHAAPGSCRHRAWPPREVSTRLVKNRRRAKDPRGVSLSPRSASWPGRRVVKVMWPVRDCCWDA
jgi:hypothetical protein